MKGQLLFFVLISFCSDIYAQNQIGLLPQINIGFKISDSWKVNSKLEGRQLFFQKPKPAGQHEIEFERLDLELVATRSLDPLNAVGGGYLVRKGENSFTHRFIQQYSRTQKFIAFRISHRFRADETFEKDEVLQLRLRYRISWEKPLNGLELDPNEFYLKLNNEYLGILKDSKGNLEVRGLATLGYSISANNQIETGIDYRVEDLINSKAIHKIFLNIGLYRSF